MLKILNDRHPKLRQPSTPVEWPLSAKDEKLLRNMLTHLKQSQDDAFANKHHLRSGVGLAAPQVGVNKQMIAVYYPKEEGAVELLLVNPRIVSTSVKLCHLASGEGCLSVDDDHPGYVHRPFKIRVKAYDLVSNAPIEITARGYDAIVLQHEIDHLKGILFYDHIDPKNPFRKLDNSQEV